MGLQLWEGLAHTLEPLSLKCVRIYPCTQIRHIAGGPALNRASEVVAPLRLLKQLSAEGLRCEYSRKTTWRGVIPDDAPICLTPGGSVLLGKCVHQLPGIWAGVEIINQ